MSTRALLVLLCLVGSVHAAPNTQAADDIERYLTDRGVLAQMDQIRQKVGGKASELVVNAMGFLGVPYRRGGTDADTGFDCSGFVRSMYEQTVGLVLPRRARDQAAATEKIDKQDLQPGDLLTVASPVKPASSFFRALSACASSSRRNATESLRTCSTSS